MKLKLPFAALALSFVFAVGVVAPVYAVVDDSMTYEEKLQYIEEYKQEAAKKKQELREQAEKEAQEIKLQNQEKAKELKEQYDQKRQEVRKQLCEKKSEQLGDIVQKRAQSAKGFYERFSSFNDKVDRFIEAKSLEVENYTELVTAVEDAAVNAEEAIASLEGLQFEVNCEDVDLTTQNTQSYRDAVAAARVALKDYKTALVNYLRAVVTSYNASQNSDATEDSSNTGDSEDTSTSNDTTSTDNSTEGGSDVQ